MGLVGHLTNCSGKFAMYIHVNYNYMANGNFFDIVGLLSAINILNLKKNILSFKHHIVWYNWINLKYKI